MGTAQNIAFSVIIPVLNGEKFIRRALDSIYKQAYPSVEILVFDGGSTDKTLNILDRASGVTIIHGPDHGPHEAMNRGINIATGEIITFLNSDDIFADDIFALVSKTFGDDPSLEIVGGASTIISQHLNGPKRILAKRTHKKCNGLDMGELTLGAPCFNSRFFKRSLFNKIGHFNLQYQYAADRELLLRAAMAHVRSQRLNPLFYVFESHQGSRTLDHNFTNRKLISEEHRKIAESLIAKSNHNNDFSRKLRIWLGFENLRQAFWSLKANNWSQFLKIITNSTRKDISWLVLAVYGLILAEYLWHKDRKDTNTA